MYFDPAYLAFAIPGLILGLIAQILIWVSFSAYSKRSSKRGLTGSDVASLLVEKENLPVDIRTIAGKLTDNFDPTRDIVSISEDNIDSNSVANIAVVAHEFGHVQQKFSLSLLFRLRSSLVPVVQVGSNLGYILFFVGLLLSVFRLAEIGLILFASTTVFALVTLPVEFDASRRGLALIKKYDLIAEEERGGARAVLTAAALTYIAGFVTSLLNLLYYASFLSRSKD